MMKISTKVMAMNTLIMSTMLVISSTNWFSMWMGLEINMLSFIPLMKKEKNIKSTESMMMYFLIQSLGSILFLFTMIMSPISMIMENMNLLYSTIIMMSMMMKLGIAPMNMWFINIMKKMSWNECLILMTWQKIAPIYILTNMQINNMLLTITSIMSTMIGSIGGINQTSIKSIMAFSSINHLGWILISMKNDNEIWIKYLIIYSIMTTMMTIMFKMNEINFISQMNMNTKSTTEKISIIMLFLSMGGLPPLIGFMPKWMVIQSMMNEESMISLMIMMFMSMVTLFYYMRMMTPMMLNNNIMNKWQKKNFHNKKMHMFNLMFNTSMPMMIMINMN